MTNGEIEVAPLAFMRGRTLAHCYAILDEAQNTTAMQMKMLLTRMGEGTRMVITGDLTQVDLPPGVTVRPARRAGHAGGRAGHRGGAVRQARRGAPSAGGAIVDAYDQRAAAQGDKRREARTLARRRASRREMTERCGNRGASH